MAASMSRRHARPPAGALAASLSSQRRLAGGAERRGPPAPLRGRGVPRAGKPSRAHARHSAPCARESSRPTRRCRGLGQGGRRRVRSTEGELRALPPGTSAADAAAESAARRGPGIADASAGPLTAFLSEPRTDYRHGVFGAVSEAAPIIAERQPAVEHASRARADRTSTAIAAGADAVFEDLEPRLADLDRDGTPEILAVKSYLARARPSRSSAGATAPGLLAETPPTGEPHRWLAPAAVADFDGDGRPDIALVRTPHLQGVLQVWAWTGRQARLEARGGGLPNHVLGSTAIDNAAAVDLDGDGRPELVIPTLDRKRSRCSRLRTASRSCAASPSRPGRPRARARRRQGRPRCCGLEDAGGGGRAALAMRRAR